jgi:holo-[acyl-carrier protein] synthase
MNRGDQLEIRDDHIKENGSWFVGIDLVDIQRFRAYPPTDHPRFYERIFNEHEYRYCLDHADPYPHFAGIFAAKEAVFKAVNKLLPLFLSQISIHHNSKQRPLVTINEKVTGQRNDSKRITGNFEIQVSITHTNKLALAWALAFDKTANCKLLDQWSDNRTKVGQVVLDELFKTKSAPTTK